MGGIQAAVDARQTRDDALATREKEIYVREAAVMERENAATRREEAIIVAVADLETREAALVAEREAMDLRLAALVEKQAELNYSRVADETVTCELGDWAGKEANYVALASFANQCAALGETGFTATPQAGLFKWWKAADRPDLGQHASIRFPSHRIRPPADLDGHDPIGIIDDVDALAAEIQAAMGTQPLLAIAKPTMNHQSKATGLTCYSRSVALRSLVNNLVVAWKAGRQGATVWWEGEAELWQRHGFCIVVATGNLGASAYVKCVAFP